MSNALPNNPTIRMLEKRREAQKKELDDKRKQIAEQNTSNVGSINTKFASRKDFKEDKLKQATFGVVTYDEFMARQETLEAGEDVGITNAPTKTTKKRKAKRKTALSFEEDEDEEEEVDIVPARKRLKAAKNPSVDTSFLPDKERSAEERAERLRLKKEWLQQQAIIKQEQILITYSYWDGCGHRRTLEVTKGTTIDRFLELVRDEFKELRSTSVENLLYIKEDLIIPHHYSFYDLIVTKARGKSGPLFAFDVHDDVRLLADATKEKDESHAGKVVERHWYERNKHIFPANRWEVYDPSVDYGKYTIKDSKKEA